MAYGPGQADPFGVPAGTGPAGTGPAGGVPAGAGWYPGCATPPPVHPAWLAATADRERTVGVLRAGFAEGRLTQDELDERVARAYASRTYGDLWALTADLPAGALPYPPPGTPAVRPGAAPPTEWRPAVALILTALVIFTLAALVTAIATAHAQPTPFPGVVQAHVEPALFPKVPGAGPVLPHDGGS